MNVKVTLVDYGIGNIFSVRRAMESIGADVVQTDVAADILASDRLILPGVGAFADCIEGLSERGLIEPLLEYATTGRPLMGICVGMQMLATSSEEFGEHAGLGLIPGRVISLPSEDHDGNKLKIPHTGWTALLKPNSVTWERSPLCETKEGESVYVVHSFAMKPNALEHRIAECEYGGHRICAAVQRGNIFGCQFHPEKSGPVGLRILARFMAI
jgi:glutamine amidotransferase